MGALRQVYTRILAPLLSSRRRRFIEQPEQPGPGPLGKLAQEMGKAAPSLGEAPRWDPAQPARPAPPARPQRATPLRGDAELERTGIGLRTDLGFGGSATKDGAGARRPAGPA